MRVSGPPILSRFRGVQRSGNGWIAFCPAHHDHERRSLSISEAEGRILLHCFVGCSAEQIVAAADMTLAELFSENGAPRARTIVTSYDYRDQHGAVVYQVVRYAPKDFRQRRPDGKGGWTWSMQGVRRVVYHLDELAETERVYLTEGEKDADRLVSVGLRATTSPGGANAWRREYGEQIAKAGVREVVLLPHHDEPGAAYARAAATDCRAAGLTVRVLALPDLPAKGGDASDWLDAGGTREALEALVTAEPEWSGAPVSGPELVREGLDLALVWPNGARFALSSIRDSKSGVSGDLIVTLEGRRLHWGAFALSATSPRETLRKKLDVAAAGFPWGDYLEEVCFRLTAAAREGEPLVTLTGIVASQTRELLPRFLYEGEPTQLYADGDNGKSLVALSIAVAVHSGAALPFGLRPARAVPCAYLDWETSRDTLEGRLGLLAAGLGVDPPAIFYKRMTRPLVDEIGALSADFARRGIGLVIIDSKMFAVSGGDGGAFHEPITAFYNALRLFAPAATLVINHVTNADARGGGPARPFGGAFAFNGPRLVWEAKRDKDVTDATAIAFTCTKANNLPRKPEPFGLRYVPGDGTITVYPMDLTEASPNVVASASIAYRVRLALDRGTGDPDAIAKEVNATSDTVKRTLRRLRQDGKARELGDGSWVLVTLT